MQPLERSHAFDRRMRDIAAHKPPPEPPVRNSTSRGTYTGAELSDSARAGAMDAYRIPSLGATRKQK